MLPGAFYQQLKGLLRVPRRARLRHDLRGPPGQTRHRPGRGGATDHPGEGARPRGGRGISSKNFFLCNRKFCILCAISFVVGQIYSIHLRFQCLIIIDRLYY